MLCCCIVSLNNQKLTKSPDFHHPDGVIRPKTGSLQSFIPNEGSLEGLGPNRFIDDEILKIFVLDIRLANADRHGGNILQVRDLNAKMIYVPIDHGYCLPESVRLSDSCLA